MLHKISLVGLLCGFVLSSGCMKVKKKGEEEKATPVETLVVAQSKSNEKFDFDYEVDEGTQKVRFQIPSTWPESVVVEKAVGNEKEILREILFPDHIWKDQLATDAKTSYKFYEKLPQEMKLIEQIDVIPVLDFDLQKDLNLTDLFGSLAFVKKIQIRNLEMKNARLFIGDFKGNIKIENLISDTGIIQTFAEGLRSSQGDGRSVGDFNLQILNGAGELSVHLFAEAGANGAAGRQPDAALTGASGAEGEPASFSASGSTNCLGMGQNMCISGVTYSCTKSPGQGGDAQDGLQGYPGEPGFQGGSVKKISLENLSSSLIVNIYKRAGRKGLGGPGGLGGKPGEPGKGGDGANRDFMRFLKLNPDDPQSLGRIVLMGVDRTCAPAASGRIGSRGPQGLSGADGEDGVIF